MATIENRRATASTANGQRPPPFRFAQLIIEGVLRRGRNADVITFKLRVLRVVELTFLVTIPEEGKMKAPVYIRFWVDCNRSDKPGTVIVE